MQYRERLTPPWWVWVLVLSVCAVLAIAYGGALGALAGLLTFAVSGTAAVWFLWLTSPVIAVTDTELWAGRAHLPLSAIGVIGTLDAAALQTTRRQDADPAAFTVVRILTSPAAVIAGVNDPSDPHPYWLISTRAPLKLAERIRHAQQGALNSYDHG